MDPLRDFRLLGPLEVRVGPATVPLGGVRQRSVLGLLLLHPNEVVSTDVLIEEIWSGEPPGTATTALQGYVSQLRKALEPERAPGAEPAVLVTRAPGYLVVVEPSELDVARAEELAATARERLAAGDAPAAASGLRSALAQWRGAPLADLADVPFAAEAARRLDERRGALLEDLFEAELAAGRHREIVPELQEAIAAHPLRERLRGQLMLIDNGGAKMVAALRRALGPRFPVVSTEGLLPVSLLYRIAGTAARGTFISVGARPIETLGAAGRRFADAFGSTQPRHHVDPVTVYAAQATNDLLDAVARSDGTRGGVTRALLGSRPHAGLIGRYAIGADGDPAPSPVTIMRVERGGGTGAIGSTDGATVAQVIRDPPRLAR